MVSHRPTIPDAPPYQSAPPTTLYLAQSILSDPFGTPLSTVSDSYQHLRPPLQLAGRVDPGQSATLSSSQPSVSRQPTLVASWLDRLSVGRHRPVHWLSCPIPSSIAALSGAVLSHSNPIGAGGTAH